MESREEIVQKAREFCPQETSECAVFINGFVKGWEECLKKYGLDREENH